MKKLYIIRHAKSSWKDISLNDFDRPLNKRGKRNAPLIGSVLKKKNILPDMILSSPALRAKTTAEIIAKEVDYSKAIVFEKKIYEATSAKLHKLLTKVNDSNNILFLFGHNPGLNILLEEYVGFSENLVTCGIAEIAFNCDKWAQISPENARLVSYEYPKKYV